MSNEITLIIDDVQTTFVRKDSIQAALPAGPDVIIRTFSAGVHVGAIKERNGQEVTLVNARRIWSWKGALSLSEVATAGVIRKDSKISVAVPEITLLQAIEIIPVASGVDLSPTGK